MLAPAAPHITEELWSRLADGARRGRGRRSTSERWPEVDESVIVEATHEVPIQVNGKLRDKVTVPAGISEIELEQIVLARDKVVAALGGRQPHAGHPRGRRQARQHRRPLGRHAPSDGLRRPETGPDPARKPE